MAYSGSKSFAVPAGTQFQINTSTTAPPVWLEINEVLSITLSGRKYDVEQTTNLQSSAKEKLKTLLDSGSMDIEYNYLGSDDPTDMALEAAFVQPAPSMFQIVIPGLPSAKTETISFSANVVEKGIDKIERGKVVKGKVKLDITNSMGFAEA